MTQEEKLQEAIQLIEKYGSSRKAVQAINHRISKSTLNDRVRLARGLGITADSTINVKECVADGITEIDVLKTQVKNLKSQVRVLSNNSITAEQIRTDILGIMELKNNMVDPEWLVPEAVTNHSSPGAPVLFCSDWHWGEIIDPGQMGSCTNAYNLDIAHERAKVLVHNTIDLLFNHMVNPNYPGLVLVLGGDMFSGDIHEELSKTNDGPTMVAFLDLFSVLKNVIKEFKKYFPKIHIVGVTGNHSRTTHKIMHKDRCFTNFDWLLYQLLMEHYVELEDDDVTFLVPDGSDAQFKVFNHVLHVTHGDEFRGGDGIIGSLGPILRGDFKKRVKQAQLGHPYDTLLVGHFHSYFALMKAIGNGSMCGYGEYASHGNFGYEIAQQALFIVHPQRGITFNIPVQLEEVLKDKSPNWVSVTE